MPRCCAREPTSLRTLAGATDGTGDHHQRHRGRTAARRRRSELVLPARLLLERATRRQVPRDHRAREAPGDQSEGAARLPRGDAGGHHRRACGPATWRPSPTPPRSRWLPRWRRCRRSRATHRFASTSSPDGGRGTVTPRRRSGSSASSARARRRGARSMRRSSPRPADRSRADRATAGARNALIVLMPSTPVEPGDYTVRVRGDGFGAATVEVKLPPPPDPGGAVFFRRGPTTGNAYVATADRRFRRNEQLRLEFPMPERRIRDRAPAGSHRQAARRFQSRSPHARTATARAGRRRNSRWRRSRPRIT